MHKLFYIILGLFILLSPVKADIGIGSTISGNVWVVDGDSLRITDKNYRKYEIRIFGINAPELSTNKGQISKRFLINIIKKNGRYATCQVIDIDKYKRYVSICQTSMGDIAEIMLKNKKAWLFKRYLHKAPKHIQQRYINSYN